MAKKKELSPEERLQEALVPEEEWPYSVPGNWCWTRLGQVCRFVGGGTPSKNNADYWDGSIPWASVKDIKGDFLFDTIDKITEVGVANSATNICEEGSLILVTRIEPGKTIVSKIRTAINQDLKIVKSDLSPIFLHYYFRTVKHLLELKSSGSTVKGITIPNIENTIIPIPPLPEQHRIVSRIESLFTKLDEAKEAAQAVVDGFEDRKAAILHKAFTGELTKEWTASQGIQNSWQTKRFDEVADIKSNLVDPLEYQDFPHIAPDNIEKKTGRLLEYNTIADDGVKSWKHRFYPGQILYSKIRPYLSKVVMVDFDGLCSADMYPIEAKEGVDTEFLWYFMLSDDFLLQASSAGSRSVLPKINQKEMSTLRIKMTILREQAKVVEIIEGLLNHEQQAKEAAEQTIDQIDTMKKSILARAFRGELGTNDPGDESAVELVKRVLVAME